MPVKHADLNAAIAELISNEVAASLAPYAATLQRLAQLISAAPAPRKPTHRPVQRRNTSAKAMATAAAVEFVAKTDASEPKVEPESVQQKPRRRLSAKRNAANAESAEMSPAVANFEVGQVVWYRQGKGAFEAKVVECAGNVLSLERIADAKRVKRPASKVIAAAVEL